MPDGPTIRLAVVIATTSSPEEEPDAVLYLSGGPGENAIEAMRFLYNRHFINFTENRDLIIFDQRGTGLSEPALDCGELITLRDEVIGQDISLEEGLRLSTQALTECHDRLEREGVNFAAYTSAESAADISELMETLNYPEWNLYGLSYGTRLALTTMRDHPEGIRSVILDSAYPLQVNLYDSIPPNASRAFDKLFDGCQSNPECNEAYPQLRQAYQQAVAGLDLSPQKVTITNPLTGETLEPLIKGADFAGFMFQSLYSTEIIPSLPKIIYDVQGGNLDLMALIMGSRLIASELISQGMQLSVQCGEEIPFTTQEAIAAAAKAHPDFTDFINAAPTLGQAVVSLCEDWGSRIAPPLENEAVISDIPTLVLAGEYDPITPPEWGKMVAEDLSNGYFFEFPGTGHGASVLNECPLDITLTFLENPNEVPDSSCASEMTGPAFDVPSGEIVLVPFSNDFFGISGMAPEGWNEIAPGVFGRTALGETAIIQQSVQLLGMEGFLNFLSGQLALDETPTATGNRQANGMEWTLYESEAQGLSIDIALTESDGTTYVVLFQTPPDDRELYYESVYLAGIDAFMPISP